jgi:hypothetical protein
MGFVGNVSGIGPSRPFMPPAIESRRNKVICKEKDLAERRRDQQPSRCQPSRSSSSGNTGRQMRSLQKFAAVHASVHNHFNQERSLCLRANFNKNRAAALAEWRVSARDKGQVYCPCGDWFELV